jgi:hypothetical protein
MRVLIGRTSGAGAAGGHVHAASDDRAAVERRNAGTGGGEEYGSGAGGGEVDEYPFLSTDQKHTGRDPIPPVL